MPRWLTKAEVSAEEEAIRQEVTMDGTVAEPQWRVIHIPEGMAINGAVVELRLYSDGIVGAEIRIPGPKAGSHG